MKDLSVCILYLLLISISLFFIGRILPKKWFSYKSFPFRTLPMEQDGNLYVRIGVRKWKEKLPDMSVLCPFLMPSKKLPREKTAANYLLMIRETCVAEFIHGVEILLGFALLLVRNTLWSRILGILFALGNLPYIIIQRYNRPKLVKLYERTRKKEDLLSSAVPCVASGEAVGEELSHSLQA